MAQHEPPFTGVGVPILTLFHEDGTLDAAGTADLAVRLVEAGIVAVVVAGTTGEAAALDPAERTALLDAVIPVVKPRGAMVLAGTGAVTAAQAVRLTRDAVEHGADAVMVLSPPWTSDPRHYYDEVAEAAGELPVIAYHYPVASAPGIPVELLSELPVAGCKDSTGDCDRLLETVAVWDGNLYVGSSAVVSYASLLGLSGAILALANAEPERCVRAFAGDAAAQRELAVPHTAMRTGDFPGCIKVLTAARWSTSITTRLG
jgi:4-hydroxy-tetrahydrodipicolinate synthase